LAGLLQIGIHHANKLIRAGEFEVFEFGCSYRVTYRSVEAFITRRVAEFKEKGPRFRNNFKAKYAKPAA
jgi:hypothetical protein